jgi:hypothetical protein
MSDEPIQEITCNLCHWVVRGNVSSRQVAEQIALLYGWHQLLNRWYCSNCWDSATRSTTS